MIRDEQERFAEFSKLCPQAQPFLVDIVQYLSIRDGVIPTVRDVVTFCYSVRSLDEVSELLSELICRQATLAVEAVLRPGA